MIGRGKLCVDPTATLMAMGWRQRTGAQNWEFSWEINSAAEHSQGNVKTTNNEPRKSKEAKHNFIPQLFYLYQVQLKYTERVFMTFHSSWVIFLRQVKIDLITFTVKPNKFAFPIIINIVKKKNTKAKDLTIPATWTKNIICHCIENPFKLLLFGSVRTVVEFSD